MKKMIHFAIYSAVAFIVLFVFLFGPVSIAHLFPLVMLAVSGGLLLIMWKYDAVSGVVKKFLLILAGFGSAGIIIVTFLFFAFCIINIPPEKTFNGDIQLTAPDTVQSSAYKTLVTLTDNKWTIPEFSSDEFLALDAYNYKDAGIAKAIASAKDFAPAVLDFLEKNAVSVPTEERDRVDYPIPDYRAIDLVVRLELASIKQLLDTGKRQEAIARYQRLWRVAARMTEGQNSLFHVLYTMQTADRLIDFMEQPNMFTVMPIKGFRQYVDTVYAGVDRSMQDSFKLEYVVISAVFNDMKTNAPTLQFPNSAIANMPGHIVIKWPFYDKNAVKRMLFEEINAINVLCVKPYHEIAQELEKALTDFNTKINNRQVKNPTGKMLLALAAPEYSRFVMRKDAVKGRIEVLTTVADMAVWSITADKLPIDPLTGKSYIVREENGMKQIVSEMKDRDKERIVFALK